MNNHIKMTKVFIFILSISFTSTAFSDFLPTSKFWGISEGVILVKIIDDIVAMEDRNGNRFNLPEIYERVSDFSNGVCTINVRGAFVQKAFYLKEEDGKLVRVDIDFLKFRCEEI